MAGVTRVAAASLIGPPLVATFLGANVGWYVQAMAVLSMLCLLALPETGDHRL